jgi:hypothetical protein
MISRLRLMISRLAALFWGARPLLIGILLVSVAETPTRPLGIRRLDAARTAPEKSRSHAAGVLDRLVTKLTNSASVRLMLSFALVLIGMVIVLAFLVNWWEPEDRPPALEEARHRVTRALRELLHPRTHRHN